MLTSIIYIYLYVCIVNIALNNYSHMLLIIRFHMITSIRELLVTCFNTVFGKNHLKSLGFRASSRCYSLLYLLDTRDTSISYTVCKYIFNNSNILLFAV